MSHEPDALEVDRNRLLDDLDTLSRYGRTEDGGISRHSFSAADLESRGWLLQRCADAGLVVDEDGIGNLIISSPDLEAGIADRAPVWTGSHIDTVPNGGAYDGALGSVAALECLRTLHENAVRPARPVRAVIYTDEEGNYGHLLGSNALARGYSQEELNAFVGRDGDRFVDAFAAAGRDPATALATRMQPGSLHATVELHIEQGPIMEQRTIDIGVVTGIVSISGGVLHFGGRADHAGTTPMSGRRDCAVAAAEFVAALPGLPPRISEQAVSTCGILQLEPGGANVIPHAAHVTVDFRDPDHDKAVELRSLITATAEGIAARHGVEVRCDLDPVLEGARMHGDVRDAISQTAAARGYSTMDVASGAGHDSQNMAQLAPTGMIFVPSRDGRSHCPQEWTDPDDVVRGANTLLGTVLRLAG